MGRIGIVAFAAALNAGPAFAQQGDTMQGGQGGGMMGQREMTNLKALSPERTVQAVRYCKGQYLVSTVTRAPKASVRFRNLPMDHLLCGPG